MMTFRLMFVPEKIPRTTTREQWRKMWRWKREAESRLRADIERATRDLVIFDETRHKIGKDIAEGLINPPLLVRE